MINFIYIIFIRWYLKYYKIYKTYCLSDNISRITLVAMTLESNNVCLDATPNTGLLHNGKLTLLDAFDDIIYFKYEKIINKELGPVILGIELKDKNDIHNLLNKMTKHSIIYEKLNQI